MIVSDLKPNLKNPRKVTDKKLKALKKSMNEFGDLGGVVFNKRSGQLIGGHQRISLLKDGVITLGESGEFGFIEKDGHSFALRVVDWGADKEKAANIAANKGAGEWDWDQLKDWFKELDDVDFDLDLTMFDEDERAELLKEPEVFEEGLTDPDSVPDNVETRCKPGDLWMLGNHRLLCGDSTDVLQVERLMGGEKADMVFTDPPYGYKYESHHQSKHKMLENDDKILDFFPAIYSSLSDNCAVFVCGSHQTICEWKSIFCDHFAYKNMIVWKKNNWSMGDLKGAFAGQYELILFGTKGKIELVGDRDSDIWDFKREPPKEHPTQKPIDMIVYAIGKVPSTKVLDLFLGSGSTLIACEKTRRECYGMEIDPHYCDVIIERWEKYTGQKAVLSGSGQ